eukprot:SAG31_NODE_159_length_21911_cov_12.220750_23_plen_216_part_00
MQSTVAVVLLSFQSLWLFASSWPMLPQSLRATPLEDGNMMHWANSTRRLTEARRICLSGLNDATIIHPTPVVGSCRALVGVLAPVTSRGKKYRGVGDTPYVTSFIKTVFETLASSDDHDFDVVMYVSYDAGDLVWDTDQARKNMPGIMKNSAKEHYYAVCASGICYTAYYLPVCRLRTSEVFLLRLRSVPPCSMFCRACWSLWEWKNYQALHINL